MARVTILVTSVVNPLIQSQLTLGKWDGIYRTQNLNVEAEQKVCTERVQEECNLQDKHTTFS